jgi:tRNA (guanine10-N2)-methyltransferase
VRFPNEAAARETVKRCILVKDVFELWGEGTNYEELHEDVPRRSQHIWKNFNNVSWKFVIHCFSGTCSLERRDKIMRSFQYMGIKGPIRLKNPEQEFHVMEEYIDDIEIKVRGISRPEEPRKIYLGRMIGKSCRDDMIKYDLKKRRYISTTSMDAELSLVTANMALAAPGKLFFDPFVGTGSFTVCASHFGAMTLGADIDGRSFRGKDSTKLGVLENYIQYGTKSRFVDVLTSDLTNTPFRRAGFLDGIVCDPPYGVREGLRVLGERKGKPAVNVIIDGVPAYLYVF